MSVDHSLAEMEQCALIKLIHTGASVDLDTVEEDVKLTLMSVHQCHVKMVLHVWTESMHISVDVELDLVVNTAM